MTDRESQPTIFATTRWTLVCDAAKGGDSQAVDPLEDLFRTYGEDSWRFC